MPRNFFISVASVACQRCILLFGFRCFACKNCSAYLFVSVTINCTMSSVTNALYTSIGAASANRAAVISACPVKVMSSGTTYEGCTGCQPSVDLTDEAAASASLSSSVSTSACGCMVRCSGSSLTLVAVTVLVVVTLRLTFTWPIIAVPITVIFFERFYVRIL